ncbi:MAG: septum formation initiator family protein [Treponema sp.]|jgi:cell division protein FtsL|nr:septum formation initiator family protein [Treponema sp.]
MIKRYLLMYFFVFTIPVFLGVVAWQSVRYKELERNVQALEAVQEKLVENNKKLIALVAVHSSSARIEQVAVHDLGLSKMRPEDVLQIRIEERQGNR